MDPLSVTASVVGLLGAAAKVYGLLEFISSAKNAPTTLREAQIEVNHVEITLRSLQRYLLHLDLADARRRECIQMDELIIALSDAMLVFSDFESLLALLTRLTRIRAAMSWFKYAKQISEHTIKIQRNKTTLIFMLNILQCESDLEASQSRERLQMLVEQILADNDSLRRKMSLMQDAFDARSRFTITADSETDTIRLRDHEDRDDATILPAPAQRSSTSRRTRITSIAFERILENSRVYRRYHDGECDTSFIHSDQRSHAWSCFTGYSLADISVLSLISMPLTQIDIANGQHYEFILADEEYDSDTVPSSVMSSAADGEEASEKQAAPQALARRSHVRIVLPEKRYGTTARKLVGPPEPLRPEPVAHISDDKYHKIARIDPLDSPCMLCGEVIAMDAVSHALAGRRWHVDCFRCAACDVLLNGHASARLCEDGSVVCGDCNYTCSSCDAKITGLAILTEDRTFCRDCFRCGSCDTSMHGLQYARTSPQTIYCVPCHGQLMARRRKRLKAFLQQQQSGSRASTLASAGEHDGSDQAAPRPPPRLRPFIPLSKRIGRLPPTPGEYNRQQFPPFAVYPLTSNVSSAVRT